MKNNNALAQRESTEKERTHEQTSQISAPREKGFRIPIWNGIFEHYGRLKDARWLLDLFVDWTTKEVPAADGSRDGLVLGGKPVHDEDTARAFGCCARTTRRWRQRLAHFGYIHQLRTPVGYVIRVKKSKKWSERPDKNVRSDRTKMSDHSESELPSMSDQKYRSCPIRTTKYVRSNKDSAVQDRDKAAAPLNMGPWKAIGLNRPAGDVKFREFWESSWASRNGRPLSQAMGEAADAWEATGGKVPGQFFARLAEIRKQEASSPLTISRMPTLADIRPKEH